MNKIMGYATVLLMVVFSISGCRGVDIKQRTGDSRAVVKEFGESLKESLQAAIKAGGPVNAIVVCNVTAPSIAKEKSEKHGWEVRRTSLKLRNPENAPDDWERRVLLSFEKRKEAGEDVTKLEYVEVVKDNGTKQFRYMKAIPTVEICTKCHGTGIPEEVREQLDKLYPLDNARDYNPGDIRGAFSIIQPL